MTEDDLEKLRVEYEKLKRVQQEITDIITEISALEKTDAVKRYLLLTEQLNNNKNYLYSHIESKDDMSLISSCIGKVKIKETNGIFVYVGTYMVNHEIDIVHGSTDFRVNYCDQNADYSQYKNIESSSSDSNYIINVPVSKRSRFEQEHTVVFPKSYFKDKEFYEMQNEFFKDAIKYGQEEAVQRVLAKGKRM